jgi:hypothetical protein
VQELLFSLCQIVLAFKIGIFPDNIPVGWLPIQPAFDRYWSATRANGRRQYPEEPEIVIGGEIGVRAIWGANNR